MVRRWFIPVTNYRRFEMFQTKTWVEVGIWNAGEPALLVMSGVFDENDQLFDTPEVLHDVPLTFPADYHDNDDMLYLHWEQPLRDLGYRVIDLNNREYGPYSVIFDVQEV
jgi:hypothetical protein